MKKKILTNFIDLEICNFGEKRIKVLQGENELN